MRGNVPDLDLATPAEITEAEEKDKNELIAEPQGQSGEKGLTFMNI
jgi:hypothetical protein